jgi:hypothetical protein
MLMLREARDVLGPQDEDELRTRILDQVAKYKQLQGAPMPIEAMVEWLDKLTLKGAHFLFNSAIERLVKDGLVVRKGRAYATGKPQRSKR